MSEPRTEAGKRLLAYEVATGADGITAEDAMNAVLGRHWEVRDAILAIEAEAMALGSKAERTLAGATWDDMEVLSNPTSSVSTEGVADGAYRERNAVVAALIRVGGYPAQVVMAPDAPDWWIVYVETPKGQLSWHISPDDMDLFRDWPVAFGTAKSPWDGHTTEQKYDRIARLTAINPDSPVEPDRG